MRSLKRLRCTTRFEMECWKAGYQLVAGVDEVGRGALFGPVVAAAVILDPSCRIPGIQDSKQLSPEKREDLSRKIRGSAIGWAVGSVDATQIDRVNIYQASRLAMQQAVLGLSPGPDFLLIDALRLDISLPQVSIVHGDALSVSIAAASIVAKVERDGLLRELDARFPQYQLGKNKGYATRDHRNGLREHGPCELHRFSYQPVALSAKRPEKSEPVTAGERPPQD